MEFIKLDYDSKFDCLSPYSLSHRLFQLKRILNIGLTLKSVYETNKGLHLTFTTETPLSYKDITFIQSILGSDYVRELFNYRMAHYGLKKRNNVLFSRKIKKGKVLSQERITPLANYYYYLLKAEGW